MAHPGRKLSFSHLMTFPTEPRFDSSKGQRQGATKLMSQRIRTFTQQRLGELFLTRQSKEQGQESRKWLSCALALSSPSQQATPGAPQPYLESKWRESQSKAEVLLGSSGPWPENSLRLARVGGQGAKCKLFLSDSVSRKAGHRQNLKKRDHFPLAAGDQQLSQSNERMMSDRIIGTRPFLKKCPLTLRPNQQTCSVGRTRCMG